MREEPDIFIVCPVKPYGKSLLIERIKEQLRTILLRESSEMKIKYENSNIRQDNKKSFIISCQLAIALSAKLINS